MKGINQSSATTFLILGFSDFSDLKETLFIAFLLIYLITLSGNIVILGTICSNSHLHTPMYFFLANLSILDISYISTTFPKMLANFFLEKTHVSQMSCLLQSYFFMAMVWTEIILLTVMAYDRYVAICNPLRYTVVMNKATSLGLAAGAWLVGLLDPIAHVNLLSRLSFCHSNEINHFFCDITALLMLSCSSTQGINTLTVALASTITMGNFILTLTSYVCIISAILKIKSSQGRQKTFSTCASHLTVVILFYGAIIIMYLRPTTTYSVKYNKIYSLVYIAAVPLCNPFIYILKNKDLKNALIQNVHKLGTSTNFFQK